MPKGDPNKTFKRGALFAFALVSVLYLLANVAYVRQLPRRVKSAIDSLLTFIVCRLSRGRY